MIVFVDASFLIALFNKDDQLHKKAATLITSLEKQETSFIVSNIVLAETINVIFRLQGAKKAQKFYQVIKKTKIKQFFVPKKFFEKAYLLLWKQRKRGLNFFDCLHLATIKYLKIKTLLTFDEDFKNRNIKILGLNDDISTSGVENADLTR